MHPVRHVAAVLCLATLVGCGSQTRTPSADDPAAVIASVRDSLQTDRIEGADLNGSRLTLRLRPVAAGEAAISLWYAKLLAQEVSNRLGRPIAEVDYIGTGANGGPDRRLHPSKPAPLPAGACRSVADGFAGAEVTGVEQIDVLGGACAFVLRPQDAKGFVADAGGEVAPLRDLPGGPNARPTLIEVVDSDGTLRFVLTWIPSFGGSIGQGSAWVQPGWPSSAILPRMEQIPTP